MLLLLLLYNQHYYCITSDYVVVPSPKFGGGNILAVLTAKIRLICKIQYFTVVDTLSTALQSARITTTPSLALPTSRFHVFHVIMEAMDW